MNQFFAGIKFRESCELWLISRKLVPANIISKLPIRKILNFWIVQIKSLASLVKAFFNLIQNVTATGKIIVLQKFVLFIMFWNMSHYFWMIGWMKHVKTVQIAKVQIQVLLLNICLPFSAWRCLQKCYLWKRACLWRRFLRKN